MSGTFQNVAQDAPGGIGDTVSGAQSSLASTYARVAERQAQSEQFIVEHGAAVLGGHSPVAVDVPTASTPMTGDVFDPNAD